MSYQTTAGWSILSSGIITLLLELVLPFPSLYWGIAFIVVGVVVLYVRQT